MKSGYKNLSKDELYLISRAEFEKQKLITTPFVQKLFPDKNKASRVLFFLAKKGRLLKIEKGKYVLVPIKAPNQQWMPNEFILAALWMGTAPYYIGYFTMYNYWGFTEQIPRTIFVLNTAKSRKTVIQGIRYEAVKIDPGKYYGVQKIKIEDQEVCISDKERTLVDFAYNPLGSMRNFESALQTALKEIDVEKFIRYLKQFPVVSVRKRAGFLLRELGCGNKALEGLRKSLGTTRTFVLLNPFNPARQGKLDKEWQVIVNR